MIYPKLPANEVDRLEAILQYQLLDTLPESDYDNITKLVASICNVPISLITILDENRNFFKSHHGFNLNESPRDISFCSHAIVGDENVFVIRDARLDERFKDNPLVVELKAIFYAGVSLINPEGFALGALCVFDHQPRDLSESQLESLAILGKQVVNLFELRRKNLNLEVTKTELMKNNLTLKNFASHVSHDLKSPLTNIISLTSFLRDDTTNNLSFESKEYLNYIQESAAILNEYIDGILKHYQTDELLNKKKEDVNLSELINDIKQLLITRNDELVYPKNIKLKKVHKSALTQILINLIDNALKYNNCPKRIIDITYIEEPHHHNFSVTDNGLGIAEDQQESIFDLFKTIYHKDKKPSTGIGLSTVKELVIKLGGEIKVNSKLGSGSTFTFTIKK